MADVTYSVAVEYFSKGRIDPGLSAAEHKAKSFSNTLAHGMGQFASSFNSQFDSLAGSIISTLGGAAMAAGGALAGGFALAVHEMIKVNEELENAKISIAAISRSTGESANISGGLRIAGDVVKEMRRDAAKLPGEFSDLQNILTTIMPATGRAGIGAFGSEKIAAMTMAAGSVLGVQMGVAGREVAAMMEGRATSRMPMFAKLGFHDAKKFNAMGSMERIRATREALENVSGNLNDPNSAVAQHAKSWTGIKNTAKDNIKMALGTVGGDTFERLKDRVFDFNNLAGGQRGAAIMDRLVPMSQQVSDHLVKGFDWAFGRAEQKIPSIGNEFLTMSAKTGVITAFIEEWGPHAQNFTRTLWSGLNGAFGGASIHLEHMKNAIQRFMDDPLAFHKLEKAAKTLIALRTGSGVLGGAAGMLPGMAQMLGSGGGGALAAAALPVAAVLAALAFAADGAVHAVMDSSSAFHTVAKTLSIDIMRDLGSTGEKLAQIWENIEPLREALGTGLLYAVNQVTTYLQTLATVVEWGTGVMRSSYEYLREIVDPKKGRFSNAYEDDVKTMYDQIHRNFAPEMIKKMIAMDAGAQAEKNPPPPPNHTTHIHKVEIRVNSNQDPSRIAKQTLQVLADYARRPKTSPYDPTAPMIRGF